ncbi:ABC transporter permease [Paenibacillus arenilitoris]|uniref:ABC transporter permease subunit n=1 Tax=Paenibacillus arenilitoris TaxID=2772299 RepID=A0A927CJW4_9BACL|nr:ABC transporter permease subunit [Paenibacillus arenilitoris]MBD2867953.1 ABC transporter permease subunit [Paenibacillus arenilitoris]
MGNFLQLVHNENIKIYKRARSWVMLGILVASAILISILWLSFGGRDTSMWEVMSTESMILFMLLTIFAVVIAASSVAEEFASGTIKLLLIRPWSRSKILLSKYVSIMLFAVLLAAVLFASTWLINWICFGINSAVSLDETQQMLLFPGSSGPFAYMLMYYGMKLLSLAVTLTLAFMISTIFRSGALAIGLSLFLLLGVNNFVLLLGYLEYEWIDYLLFMHLDLTKYIGATRLEDGSNLWFSLGILGAYYVIFVALTWYVFNKRDVAA